MHVRRDAEQGDRRVEVRDIHVLTFTGPLAREQRDHDPERAVQARAAVVGDEVERNLRRAPGLADQAQDARQRQEVQVVRRHVTVRSGLSEPRERAIHDARIETADGVVIRTEPLHHARTKPFDDDVGRPGELPEDRLAISRLEV